MAIVSLLSVMGMAELFNFTGGSFPWTRDRLRLLANSTGKYLSASRHSGVALDPVRQVVLLVHQPFRCREGVPDWYFCFSSEDKAALQVRFV